MPIISVPLSPELATYIEKAAEESGRSKADIMRQALKKYREDEEVNRILAASREPSLEGGLDTLLDQIDT